MCTTFQVRTEDNKYFHIMNMELFTAAGSRMLVAPRGHQYKSEGPDGLEAMSWVGKYGVVGNSLGPTERFHGAMNEKGLSVTGLYLPDFTEYMAVSEEDNGNFITYVHLIDFVSSQFEYVEEVKAALSKIKVCDQKIPEFGNVSQPIHFAVYDKLGYCLVIEFVGGEMKLYDNPYGTLANAPTFDWHLANLRNYTNISNKGYLTTEFREGETIMPLGAGSGTLGLPGDDTAAGRFVRAAFYSNQVTPKNWDEGMVEAIQLSNKATVTSGSIKYNGKGFGIDADVSNICAWRHIASNSTGVFFQSHYGTNSWLKFDTNEIDFDTPGIRSMNYLNTTLEFKDLSHEI
ncbi:choloylglycine hydrolase [Vibrio inusitatus NBRC 102082]|uniref:Choloylglycine hydrolase n=1 Tax=Vibrio inusitatus NBRC 102082 TaxID=1219070 RepID=A0A4Y3HR29_9VIBR|nr:linear amide C-N hydrolase [Vibrio inusitatus]GEA49516.1 choloylglycine hydrolase [Vibrio inusitatus NBRC 102082]